MLTEKEMLEVWHSIESWAGLDNELHRRCIGSLHAGEYDQAVLGAFGVLEQRLRAALRTKGGTGIDLVHQAFGKNGALATKLGRTENERTGFRELFCGAFTVFRNPVAHGVVGYTSGDSKAILGLVNLLLGVLGRTPPPLTESIEHALEEIEASIDSALSGRVRAFLAKCVQQLRLEPTNAKTWIPFRRYAMCDRPAAAPQVCKIAVFYFIIQKSGYALHFPTDQYYSRVVGFDGAQYKKALFKLGLQPNGAKQEPRLDLRAHNDQPLFDALYDIVAHTAGEFENTLRGARSDSAQEKWLIS